MAVNDFLINKNLFFHAQTGIFKITDFSLNLKPKIFSAI